MTLEFYKELMEHLNPEGVIVSNLISSLIGDTSELLYSEVKTIKEVFPNLYLFSTQTSLKSVVQNIILVASTDTSFLGPNELITISSEKEYLHDRFRDYIMNQVRFEEVLVDKAFILTDNYAPTEKLLNPVTLAPYKRGGEQIFRVTVNPLIIAATWITALIGVFIIINNYKIIKGKRTHEDDLD
jgi:hypothetical protein